LTRESFLDVGGFSVDYVIGDYEDSDLCLKLRERGASCLYAADVELYHFERQSMRLHPLQSDRGSTAYNRALHTKRWDSAITEVMSAQAQAAAR
jgi:GT2 family glycosyltransferase